MNTPVSMTQIDLADCQTLVISLKDAVERRKSIDETCKQLGLDFEIIDAVKCNPGWMGCALSHIKALRRWNGKRPLLVLEDDIAPGGQFHRVLDIPKGADAVYLGTSMYGGVPSRGWQAHYRLIAAEQVGPNMARIFNMMSSHAILHLSGEWVTGAINSILQFMTEYNLPPDMGLAKRQADFRVYSQIEPNFFQSVALQSEGGRTKRQGETIEPLILWQEGQEVDFKLLEEDRHRRYRLERFGERLEWTTGAGLP
jgi:hypothetical protein